MESSGDVDPDHGQFQNQIDRQQHPPHQLQVIRSYRHRLSACRSDGGFDSGSADGADGHDLDIDIVFVAPSDCPLETDALTTTTACSSNGNVGTFSINLNNFSGKLFIRGVSPPASESFSELIQQQQEQQHDEDQEVQSSPSTRDKVHRNTFSLSTSQWLDRVLEGGQDEQTNHVSRRHTSYVAYDRQSPSMSRLVYENEQFDEDDKVKESMPAHAVGLFSTENNKIHPSLPQKQQRLPSDPLEHQRSVSVGSISSQQFQPEQLAQRRSHLRRRTVMALPHRSMRDVIGTEDLDIGVVPSLLAPLEAAVPSEAERATEIEPDEDDDPSTAMTSLEILQVVASPYLSMHHLEEILRREGPDIVKVVDGKNRTPLHILGSNSDLVSTLDGQLIAKQCAIVLMELYPEAITLQDDDGRMPFVMLIEKWVEWTHEQGLNKSRTHGSKSKKSCSDDSPKEQICSKLCKLIKPNQFFDFERTSGRGGGHSFIRRQESGTYSNSQRSSMHDSSNRFPPVVIFEEVEWCFEMLSIAMDHLGGKPLDISQHTRPSLSYRKQRKDRLMLAENIAGIPQLLKTTMLLESNETRSKILESSVVRRALLCPQIVGPWLTSMLRYTKGTASDTCVEFLMTLSTLSVEDFIGDYRKPLPRDGVEFNEAKLSVFGAVWNLRDLTPSLLVLSDELWDRALATPLIWYCINKEVTTPFAVSIATSDFQLIITTIIAVREVAFGHVAPDGRSDVFPFLNIISVIFFTCLYSVIRRICEFYALFRISSRVAWRYFLDPWHLLDFIAVFSAMLASANYSKIVDEGGTKDDLKAPIWAYAILLVLLWLRILACLKAVNERLATFILALTNIFFDIRYFCAVLLVIVLLFGDVFHLLFTGRGNYQACDADEPNPASADFCTQEVLDSYLRVYAIIVGDFDLSDFRQNTPITIAWFFVTFVGLIVLLNTLIAIISVSYEKSHDSSQLLFRRARCVFVAGNAAVQGFLRPRLFYSQSSSTRRIDFAKVSAAVVRWILILVFTITVGMSAVYIISRIVGAIEESNVLSVIALMFLSVVMLYVFWAAIVVLAGFLTRLCYGENADRSRFKRFFTSIDRWAVEFIATYMFGVDTEGRGGEPISLSDNRNDDIMEKLSYLEKTLEQLLENQKQVDAVVDHCQPRDGDGVNLLLPPTSD